jgi:serine/threonine protein kinase
MSDTAVCRDRHLDRLVVVKSLKPDTDPERLLDELAALQEIRSKHVVQIYDVIRDCSDAICAIAEECLTGDDLYSAPAPSSADELMKVLYQIAEGIADIHAHGLIHRDIKPNNMKLDGEGCLKIFDFGLSRLETSGATTTDIIMTPGFGAPEFFLRGPLGRSSSHRLLIFMPSEPPRCSLRLEICQRSCSSYHLASLRPAPTLV